MNVSYDGSLSYATNSLFSPSVDFDSKNLTNLRRKKTQIGARIDQTHQVLKVITMQDSYWNIRATGRRLARVSTRDFKKLKLHSYGTYTSSKMGT